MPSSAASSRSVPSMLAFAIAMAAAASTWLSSHTVHAQPTPRGATGRLIVICLQEGASVYVDETLIGTVPIEPQTLAAGEHSVRVVKPGFTEFSEVVTIRRGADTQVETELLAISTVAHVRSEPEGAQVFVDGVFRGQTPIDIDLNEGERSLRIRRQGFAEQIRTLQATAGTEVTIALTLVPLDPDQDPSRITAEPRAWYERPLVWVAAGAVAVTFALVAILIATSSDDPSQVDIFCGTPPRCIRIDAP